MKITVITVVYNNSSGIELTIKSVLNQTYKDLEYIIIDGCSTDGTVKIIEQYVDRVSLFISEKDGGIYDAMNKGIINSTGDYIIFLNSGDTFVNDNVLDEATKFFKKGSEVVYGSSIQINTDGTEQIKKPYPIIKIEKGPIFRHNAAFFKLEVHRNYMYDLTKSNIYGYGLDFNTIFDMYKAGIIFQEIDMPIVRYDMLGISANRYLSTLYAYRITHKNEFNLLDWLVLNIKLLIFHKYKKS